MKLIQKIAIHLIILFIVIIFPVIVYEFMSSNGYYDFAFIGGISYFIYAFYFALKIKKHRAKVIILGILSLLLALCIGLLLSEINVFIPIILLIINLILQAFLVIKNPRYTDQTIGNSYLINFVITLILSVIITFFWFLAMAASGMPSNHY